MRIGEACAAPGVFYGRITAEVKKGYGNDP
jgi:hypothetical protein